MPGINRRNFLKASGLAAVPALLPAAAFSAANPSRKTPPPSSIIKFFGDGEMFEPTDYINLLQEINAESPIVKDRYGSGGAVEALEQKFAAITGKDKAMYMPSGTMANQLAIAALSGGSCKVFVQDTSHVYRDEADAAQSVFQKRLVPLAKGKPFFTADEFKEAVESLPDEEVFATGIGAVSIENPVRRSDGRMVPIEEIRKISAYCRSKNIPLHLDGARIYIAAAWSGISVKEYASYFDTIYISLYKYLGASGGAILCGDKTLIEKMPHLVKVHGGSMYGSWTNAAMALHRLEGLETRLKSAIARSAALFAELNKIPGIAIKALDGGTNIYEMQLAKTIDGKKLQQTLREKYNTRIPMANTSNELNITVNETLLYQSTDYLVNAFKKSI